MSLVTLHSNKRAINQDNITCHMFGAQTAGQLCSILNATDRVLILTGARFSFIPLRASLLVVPRKMVAAPQDEYICPVSCQPLWLYKTSRPGSYFRGLAEVSRVPVEKVVVLLELCHGHGVVHGGGVPPLGVGRHDGGDPGLVVKDLVRGLRREVSAGRGGPALPSSAARQ